jgi:hypothetical protein
MVMQTVLIERVSVVQYVPNVDEVRGHPVLVTLEFIETCDVMCCAVQHSPT